MSILIVEQEVHIGDLSLTFNGRDLTKTIEKYVREGFVVFEKPWVKLTEAGYPQLLKSLKLARESLNQVNVRKGYPSLGRFFRSDAKKVYRYLTEVRDELTRRVKLPPHLLWEDNSCVKW